jgi:poly(3-hydroxybutyrate) depolymerase
MKTVCLFSLLSTIIAESSPGCSLLQTSGSWTSDVSFDGESYTHAYTYPNGLSNNQPAPLILYFHGWGGSSADCGVNSRTSATERGYATIALTGMGGENGDLNSWNGFGSTQSNTGMASGEALVAGTEYCDEEGENDRTCDLDAYELGCYKDCNGECADECWWTTCKDSVQQTVEVLEDFINNHCIDMNRIYAVGWSNGGMFTYELANDERTAKYFAAISPQSKYHEQEFNLFSAILIIRLFQSRITSLWIQSWPTQ